MSVRRKLTLSSFTAGLDDGRRSALECLRQLAVASNLRVYLVGGPVRDAMLGASVLDLDFAVEGDAIALAHQLAGKLDGRLVIHQRFRTATVEGTRARIDLVTARRESYRSPGALPDVLAGSIADDLARRDFTINAMALPLSQDDAEVMDQFTGMADLEKGVIRSLHVGSFVDDPTRMFRAIRYEQRLGFHIEDRTLSDIASARVEGHMDAVSGDRWRHELERILDEDSPGPALLRAAELDLLSGLAPAFAKQEGLKKLASLPARSVEASDWVAALFSPMEDTEAEAALHALRLTGVQAAVARDTIVVRKLEPTIAGAQKDSELVNVVSGLNSLALSAWTKLTDDPVVEVALRRYLEELRWVEPVLDGDALLGLGVQQGPKVGKILARLRMAKLDGVVNGEQEERALALSLLGECQPSVAR